MKALWKRPHTQNCLKHKPCAVWTSEIRGATDLRSGPELSEACSQRWCCGYHGYDMPAMFPQPLHRAGCGEGTGPAGGLYRGGERERKRDSKQRGEQELLGGGASCISRGIALSPLGHKELIRQNKLGTWKEREWNPTLSVHIHPSLLPVLHLLLFLHHPSFHLFSHHISWFFLSHQTTCIQYKHNAKDCKRLY